MLLIVNTLPTVCLHEPPEEVLPLLIPLLRLAFGRVIYVVDGSLLSESSALNLPSHKDLQPVLFFAIKGSDLTMDTILMPLFLVPMFFGRYLKQWQKSIQLGSRCVLTRAVASMGQGGGNCPPPILAVAPPNGSCPGHSRKPAFGNGAIAS